MTIALLGLEPYSALVRKLKIEEANPIRLIGRSVSSAAGRSANQIIRKKTSSFKKIHLET